MKCYINCYTWNDLLPVQYIWESLCGYYASRNGNLMYEILNNINEFDNRNSYINKIIKSIKFKKLISTTDSINYIKKYKKIIKNDEINALDILKIANKHNPNINQSIYYDISNINIDMKNNNYLKLITLFREKYNWSTHWIPVIIHKINNNINIHILDSFNSTWYGSDIISKLIKEIKGENKNYQFEISCVDRSTISTITMIYQKFSSMLLLIIFIYLFINSLK
jgi:hypothetical protein